MKGLTEGREHPAEWTVLFFASFKAVDKWKLFFLCTYGEGLPRPYSFSYVTNMHQAALGAAGTAVDRTDLVSTPRNSESSGAWGGQLNDMEGLSVACLVVAPGNTWLGSPPAPSSEYGPEGVSVKVLNEHL